MRFWRTKTFHATLYNHAPYFSGFVPGPYNMVLWVAPHLRAREDLKILVGWLKDELLKLQAEPAAASRRKL